MSKLCRPPGSDLPRGCFVTATDTGVGKTWIALAMMAALQRHGLRTAAMKPVASGCSATPAGLRNADALKLWRQSSVASPYQQVNPYAFESPIAPHIAAREVGVRVDIEKIVASYRSLAAAADVAVVEGVGGWWVPLNDDETVCELAVSLQIPVVLVVGLRLGCINHALLTADAISVAGARFLGWIANHSDPSYDRLEPTLETLSAGIGAPLLDFVPWLHGASVDRVCAHLENTVARILNA